jgi:hypothetical protein
MMVTHLPNGPTAFFKLSGVVMGPEVPNRGEVSSHRPELILNGFNTRLGHTVGRMFAALLPHDPQFKGRQVITFHNQRDFVFVRFHRYIVNDAQQVDLQELGPRFTLKLQWLQKGLYDLDHGEFEWHHKVSAGRRPAFLTASDLPFASPICRTRWTRPGGASSCNASSREVAQSRERERKGETVDGAGHRMTYAAAAPATYTTMLSHSVFTAPSATAPARQTRANLTRRSNAE